MGLNELLTEELDELKKSHNTLLKRYEALANDYIWAMKLYSHLVPVESSYEVLKAEFEKITSEHMALQTTHKELESSHEKLVESYAALDVAHEVLMTSVKLYQPPTHMHMLTC
jgi:predicted nuclease with TOPRIM domain